MATTTTNQSDILTSIRSYLERFIVFSDDALSLIVALWVLHTWTFMESFPRRPWVTPYLYVYSEEPGAGKTTVIRVIKGLVYNPEQAGDMTSAAMFTMIEETHPTLLVDETDTVFNSGGGGNENLRRTMNTGYEESGYAIRKVGKSVEKFSTFCAKLLAGLHGPGSQLPETVQTRSIPLQLFKSHPRERFYAHLAGPDAQALSEDIDAWIRHNGEAIIDYLPEPIESMEPRAFEISVPILQLAHALGVEEETRSALIRILAPQRDKTEDPLIALLRRLREIFDAHNADKLHTVQILEELGDSWGGKLLSRKLEQFKDTPIGTTTSMSIPGRGTKKGYYRHQFQAAWDRYLG